MTDLELQTSPNADVSIYFKVPQNATDAPFNKTVTNIVYHYHQGSINRPMDQESKYCGN